LDDRTTEATGQGIAAFVIEGPSVEDGSKFGGRHDEKHETKQASVNRDGVGEKRPPGGGGLGIEARDAPGVGETAGDDLGKGGVGTGGAPGPGEGEGGGDAMDGIGAEVQGGLPAEGEVGNGDVGQEHAENSDVEGDREDLGDDEDRPGGEGSVDFPFPFEGCEACAEGFALLTGEMAKAGAASPGEGGCELADRLEIREGATESAGESEGCGTEE